VKLEDLINRSAGLGVKEKAAIFHYVIARKDEESSEGGTTRQEYIRNLIIIFNSFFEYGFIHGERGRKNARSSSSGGGEEGSGLTSSEDHESFSREASRDLESSSGIKHYWDYIAMNFTHLESVKYINFYYEEASTSREKALGWIMLLLSNKRKHEYKGNDDLKQVFLEIFSNIPIL